MSQKDIDVCDLNEQVGQICHHHDHDLRFPLVVHEIVDDHVSGDTPNTCCMLPFHLKLLLHFIPFI